jgi:hypothetical protein
VVPSNPSGPFLLEQSELLYVFSIVKNRKAPREDSRGAQVGGSTLKNFANCLMSSMTVTTFLRIG